MIYITDVEIAHKRNSILSIFLHKILPKKYHLYCHHLLKPKSQETFLCMVHHLCIHTHQTLWSLAFI